MDLESQNNAEGTSRRSFIRRAGLAGGVAWVAPQVVNASVAHAQVSDPDCITIDDYQTPQFVSDAPGGPTASDTVSGADESSIIGGTRTLTLQTFNQATGGQTPNPSPSTASIGGGFFSVNTQNRQSTIARLSYTNGPWNLSAVNRIEMKFDVEENTPAGDVVVKLTFNGVTQSRTIPVGESTQTFFINSFGIDSSNVTGIALEINARQQVVVGADTLAQCFQACPDGRFAQR